MTKLTFSAIVFCICLFIFSITALSQEPAPQDYNVYIPLFETPSAMSLFCKDPVGAGNGLWPECPGVAPYSAKGSKSSAGGYPGFPFPYQYDFFSLYTRLDDILDDKYLSSSDTVKLYRIDIIDIYASYEPGVGLYDLSSWELIWESSVEDFPEYFVWTCVSPESFFTIQGDNILPDPRNLTLLADNYPGDPIYSDLCDGVDASKTFGVYDDPIPPDWYN